MTRASLSSSSLSSSNRRPVRRRKSVTHYSDDNPNCFTVKRKKGESPEDKEEEEEQQVNDEKDRTTTTTSSRFERIPKKRKVGRPPSSSTTTAKWKQRPPSENKTLSKRKQQPQARSKVSSSPKPIEKPEKESVPMPNNDADAAENEDTILAHTAMIQPILPSLISTTEILQRSRPNVLSETAVWSLHKNSASSFPQWQPVTTTTTTNTNPHSSSHHHHHHHHHPGRITWWSARSDDGDSSSSFAVSGDCWGIVSLWNTAYANGIPHLIRRITHTSAHMRERNRIVKSKKVISYPNAIVQCVWHRAVIIVCTSQEIEAIDIQQSHHHHSNNNSSSLLLWRIPIRTSIATETVQLKKMGASQTPALQLLRIIQPSAAQQQQTNSNDDKDHKQQQQQQQKGEDYCLLWSTGHREIDDTGNDTPEPDDKASLNQDTISSATSSIPKRTTTTAQSLLQIQFHVPTTANPWNAQHGMNMHDQEQQQQQHSSSNGTPSTMHVPPPMPRWTKLSLPSTDDDENDHADPDSRPVFQCWTTLWEKPFVSSSSLSLEQEQQQDTFLVLAQTANETIELIRTSILPDKNHTLQIQLRKILSSSPASANGTIEAMPECNIQQFQQYTFVMIGMSGIRMLDTNTLEDIAIFGDSVQLHGKAMVWNRCLWISSSSYVSNNNNEMSSSLLLHSKDTIRVLETSTSHKKKMMQGFIIERPDEMAVRFQEPSIPTTTTETEELVDSHSQQEQQKSQQQSWLIGIPHPFKGPAELRSTMYLWKVPSRHDPRSSPGSTISSTVLLPGPAGGWCGDVLFPGSNNNSIITTSPMVGVDAVSGEVCAWKPTFRTDFAGVMYPTEYKVITDNWEYIEDEDELDRVSVADAKHTESSGTTKQTNILQENNVHNKDDGGDDDAEMDPDLAEALRLSLLEHEQQMEKLSRTESPLITVLPDEDVDNNERDRFLVPCWPQPDESTSDTESTTSAHSPIHSPQRGTNMNENEVVFETIFLPSLPEVKQIRHELRILAEKHAQLEAEGRALSISSSAAAAGGDSVMDTSCVSQNKLGGNAPSKNIPGPTAATKASGIGKRARMANIESILWNSVDNNLRRKMYRWRGKFADGTGSSLVDAFSDVVVKAERDFFYMTRSYADNGENENVQENGNGADSDIGDTIDATTSAASVPKPQPISIRTTSEEKSLAMELLLLSPRNAESSAGSAIEINHLAQSSSTAPEDLTTLAIKKSQSLADGHAPFIVSVDAHSVLEGNTANGCVAVNQNTVVTPSEQTPAHVPMELDSSSVVCPTVIGQDDNHNSTMKNVDFAPVTGDSTMPLCPACLGRMVIHRCGKREKPIDYEALARAEEERRQREAEEKVKERAEKRRIAELKRREARKQKKKDDERKILEKMEHMRQLEGQQFDLDSGMREREETEIRIQQSNWIRQDSYQEHHLNSSQSVFHVHDQVLPSKNGETVRSSEPRNSDPAIYSQSIAEESNNEHRSPSNSWNSIRRGSIHIDGTEVKPSTCLSPADALSALAGLAMAVPIAEPLPPSHLTSTDVNSCSETDLSSSFSEHRKWASTVEPSYWNQYTQHQPYQYNGSAERRANIHKALHGHTGFNGFAESSSFPEFQQDEFVEREVPGENAAVEAKSAGASVVYASPSVSIASENASSAHYADPVNKYQMKDGSDVVQNLTVQVTYSEKDIPHDTMSAQAQVSRYFPVLPKAHHMPLKTSQFASRVQSQFVSVQTQEPKATPCITYAENFEIGKSTAPSQSGLDLLGEHALYSSDNRQGSHVHPKEQSSGSNQMTLDAGHLHSENNGTISATEQP